MTESTNVLLKNGEKLLFSLVTTISMNLERLYDENPICFIELVEKCKNKNHKLWGDSPTILEKYGLTQNNVIHNSMKAVVLSSISGEGVNLQLVNPIDYTKEKL